ncbi:uncharacterized protein LOC111085515 [Limulus polyphemus]|uniref:Uncharacterized protein LOC111085515 n=1 Tax=Limulus polyphemus TaxID=6850 RepID=A0ABM1S960_LIMPO|nr:uncharacterized protein LOC111085515 [Limulus polyphemus]XP_022240166.1 uncharacterized protein LOC111085515 [Limulus polyphemus]
MPRNFKGICWTVVLLFALVTWSRHIQADKHREYPKLNTIPVTNFTCLAKLPGYYADPHPSSGCQVYHMCHTKRRKYSYLCPNHTLFNQAQLICDHWYNVNCSLAENNYKVNDKLFAEGKIKFETRLPTIRSSFSAKPNDDITSFSSKPEVRGTNPPLDRISGSRKHKPPVEVPGDSGRGRSKVVFQTILPQTMRVQSIHGKCVGCMTFYIRDGEECTPCVWPR